MRAVNYLIVAANLMALIAAHCEESLVILPGDLKLEVTTDNPQSAIKFDLTKDRDGIYDVQMSIPNNVKEVSIWAAMAKVRDFVISNDRSWSYINFNCSMRDSRLPWVIAVKSVVIENEAIASRIGVLNGSGLEKDVMTKMKQSKGASMFLSLDQRVNAVAQIGFSFGELKVFGEHVDFGKNVPPVRIFLRRVEP